MTTLSERGSWRGLSRHHEDVWLITETSGHELESIPQEVRVPPTTPKLRPGHPAFEAE